MQQEVVGYLSFACVIVRKADLQASLTIIAGNSYKQLQRRMFTPEHVLFAQEWVDQVAVSNVFFDFEY